MIHQPPLQLALPFDSPLRGPVQNDRCVMAYRFFSLDRRTRDRPIIYDDGKVGITIKGRAIATMWDQEILIYIVSLMAEKIDRGLPADRRFTFAANDFFRVAGIGHGGSSYERLAGALERLQGTQIQTNIMTGGERTREWFSWLDSVKVIYRQHNGREVMDQVTVTLCEWLWRAIKIDNAKFTYNPKFFELPPLERRLYEMAHAHCRRGGFRMWLDKLQVRVGYEGKERKFRLLVRRIAARDRPLPGYALKLDDRLVANAGGRGRPAKRTLATFWRTDTASTVAVLRAMDGFPLID